MITGREQDLFQDLLEVLLSSHWEVLNTEMKISQLQYIRALQVLMLVSRVWLFVLIVVMVMVVVIKLAEKQPL